MSGKNRNRTTSISVSLETGAALTKLCDKLQCPKNEFVAASVEYFAKHGIDPRTAGLLNKKEIDTLLKRMDDFFAFLKRQETETIKPMAKENSEVNKSLNIILTKLMDN